MIACLTNGDRCLACIFHRPRHLAVGEPLKHSKDGRSSDGGSEYGNVSDDDDDDIDRCSDDDEDETEISETDVEDEMVVPDSRMEMDCREAQAAITGIGKSRHINVAASSGHTGFPTVGVSRSHSTGDVMSDFRHENPLSTFSGSVSERNLSSMASTGASSLSHGLGDVKDVPSAPIREHGHTSSVVNAVQVEPAGAGAGSIGMEYGVAAVLVRFLRAATGEAGASLRRWADKMPQVEQVSLGDMLRIIA